MKIKKSKLKEKFIEVIKNYETPKCADCKLGEYGEEYGRWSCSKGWGPSYHPFVENYDKCIKVDEIFNTFLDELK